MKSFIRQHPTLIGAIGSVVGLVVAVVSLAYVDARGLNANDPIDWTTKETTTAGFVESGILFDFELDCTTGQLRADTPIFDFDVMTVDPPWVAKHQTDEACRQHGFNPEF